MATDDPLAVRLFNAEKKIERLRGALRPFARIGEAAEKSGLNKDAILLACPFSGPIEILLTVLDLSNARLAYDAKDPADA